MEINNECEGTDFSLRKKKLKFDFSNDVKDGQH